MRDYDATVKNLREAAKGLLFDAMPYRASVMKDAADAIEELLAEVKHWELEAAANETDRNYLIDENRKLVNSLMNFRVPTWISVEERLPEDFQKVLVFWWEHGEPMIDTAFWQKDAKRFDGEHWVRMEDKVTHWMPLPTSPGGTE